MDNDELARLPVPYEPREVAETFAVPMGVGEYARRHLDNLARHAREQEEAEAEGRACPDQQECEPWPAREEYETRPTHPVCAWCAGTLGDVTREMRWGQASPPTYLCPDHEAKWDDVQRRATAAMGGGRELFRVQAGTGVMKGFAKSLSVSMDAAIALGLVEDPRPAAIDAMDQERWRLLQELGRQNAGQTIDGEVVE